MASGRANPAAEVYDTTVDGQSNAGQFNSVTYEGRTFRLSWDINKEKEQLAALIEYLKTF